MFCCNANLTKCNVGKLVKGQLMLLPIGWPSVQPRNVLPFVDSSSCKQNMFSF